MEREKNNGKGRFLTPVFSEADVLSYHRLKEQEKDLVIPLEPSGEAITQPAPLTLINFYSAATSEIVSEEALRGFDNEFIAKVINLIEPFITTNKNSGTQLATEIQTEANRFVVESGDFEKGEEFISLAERILDTVITDMFKVLKEALTENTNPMAIEKYFRDCWNKVLTQKNRQTLIIEFQKLINSVKSSSIKEKLTDCFILSMVNIHTQYEDDFELSDISRNILGKTELPFPTSATRNPIIIQSSSSRGNHFIRVFLENEVNHSFVAEQALELLDDFSEFGILPLEIPKFTEENFIVYCTRLYVHIYNLKENAESDDIKGAMVGIWNEIIGPQLLIVAELLLPDSDFLLPKIV